MATYLLENFMAIGETTSYLPLWQSLAGALGAFCVAAFTVGVTNKHTQSREDRTALRAKNADRRRLLRENLEESISCMEIAYRAATNSGRTVAALKIYLSGGLVPPEDKESAAGDGHNEMTRAAVLSGLYFPSL